jgi:L-2-hydroxyglutarate oxidase LhgO
VTGREHVGAGSSDSAFDVVVVGAGVIGLAIAAALARPGRSVLIVEQEPGIARGVTSRNSEVIHAGLYYPRDSLKASLCVEGREALYRYCAERRVAHRKLGKLIVATEAHEEPIVESLLERGRANGVVGLECLDRAAIRALEPGVAARLALHSPETGIVDGHGLCLALLAEAEASGAVLVLDRSLRALEPRSFGWSVEIEAGDGHRETVEAGIVIGAAGLAADRVAEQAGIDVDTCGWRQHPCKGDYFALGPGVRLELERLVYPVPQQAGLGIHATLDLAGRIRFGPDTEYVSARSGGFDYTVDAAKAAAFGAAVSRYLPQLVGAELVADYAGIRPKLAAPGEPFRDFVIEEASALGAPGFVACVGIESPGLTAALAIARRVASLVSL